MYSTIHYVQSWLVLQRLRLAQTLLSFAMLVVGGWLVGCSTLPSPQAAQLANAATIAIAPQARLKQHDRPTVALVLGSGGSRGYAHVGVLQVLEQHGIRPDLIVGSSAGSFVGAVYASGKTAAQSEAIARSVSRKNVRDFTWSRQGLLDGQKVANFVNQHVAFTPLEQLKIPMYVVVTDLQTGQPAVLAQGNTGQAVQASIAIPTVFLPVQIQGKAYVDGGISTPLPVRIARQLGADVVIAVDILAQPEDTSIDGFWSLLNQNIVIMQSQMASEDAAFADVLIQPKMRGKRLIFSTEGRDSTILAGREATLAALSKIQQVLTEAKAIQHSMP